MNTLVRFAPSKSSKITHALSVSSRNSNSKQTLALGNRSIRGCTERISVKAKAAAEDIEQRSAGEMAPPNPEYIMQMASGYWASKTLLTAVELDLFTKLASGPLTCAEIVSACGLNGRAAADFLDALVALNLLGCEGDGSSRKYMNTQDTAVFLVNDSPAAVSGFLKVLNSRLYPLWSNLGEALKTGKPQNELKQGGDNVWDKMYEDKSSLSQFAAAMTGISKGSAMAMAASFDFGKYKSMCDVGGAEGCLPAIVAAKYPNVQCMNADLPDLKEVSEKYFSKQGLTNTAFVTLDFLKNDFPSSDVFVMGHILHDWGLAEKEMLLAKAFKALPSGGACIVYDQMIDDERKAMVPGLLMSLNMLLETSSGFDYTFSDCKGWFEKAGFVNIEMKPGLAGPTSCLIGYKP